jgi:hypothetical protein
MRLVSGDNHLISARDGVLICQIWVREDLSAEDGARNAQQLVDYVTGTALTQKPPYRGLILDVRRGPPTFGPKTRETLLGLLAASDEARVPVAMLAGPAPIQVEAFSKLCSDSRTRAQVFDSEPAAVRWFAALKP